MRTRALARFLAPILLVALIAALATLNKREPTRSGPPAHAPAEAGASVEALFAARTSGVVVETSGRVDRILADDRKGSRHQRFILRLPSGHTLLVAHNIDLAERIPVRSGDTVSLRGQYEWNDRGGVLHWTHHDPQGRRPGGWIRVGDRTFR